MAYKEFLNTYYKNTNQSTRTDVEFFLQQIKDKYNDVKQILNNPSDKDIYSTIFEDKNNINLMAYKLKKDTQKHGDISLTKFHRLKSFLVNFTEFLNNNNLIANYNELSSYITELSPQKVISEDAMSHLYFKSIDDVILSIDKLGEKVLKNYNPYNDLLEIKAISILLWKGFNPQAISVLNTDNILFNNGKYYVSNKTLRKELSEREYYLIKSYCSCSSQRAIPSGKTVFFSPNKLFIKHRENTKINANTVVFKIHKYNTIAFKHNLQSLNTNVIMKCGFYEEIYNHSKAHPGITIRQNIKDLAKCDNHTTYEIYNFYIKWLNIFYGQQI